MATQDKDKKLEHTRGGVTTRDDALDQGVPMLAGDPAEPVGPEDAFGAGKKRGDYTSRIGEANYQPHVAVPVPESEREEGEPTVRLVPQVPRTENIGDEKGKKGGVQTA